MEDSAKVRTTKKFFEAFAAGDRSTVESLLAESFRFSSPPDPLLDRAGYFERCWPGAGKGIKFSFVRAIESGNEVVVTYEMTQADGRKGRNTEVTTFEGEKITRQEVYFGWAVK
jgi:hypothetical protein